MIRRDLADIPSYVPGKSDPDALKLSSNEAPQGPLPSAVDAMVAAARGANRYPDMGAVSLRRALARHLGVEPENVTVGCGSSALCQQLVQATSTPENNVIFPWRSFEAYPIFCQVVGTQARPVPLLSDGKHDLERMLSLIDDSTSLIFLCSPNNPSGQVITRSEFAAFIERVPEHVTVALDEAYVEYNRDPDAVEGTSVFRDYPNLVCLRTFSKAYGLAGTRVGYAFGAPDLIEALDKMGIPFQVSAIAQAGAIASLQHSEELLARVEDTIEARDEVADGIGALRSQANFVWLPDVDSAALARQLATRGILVRAFPEGLRVTVTNRDEAEEFLSAWKAIHSTTK